MPELVDGLHLHIDCGRVGSPARVLHHVRELVLAGKALYRRVSARLYPVDVCRSLTVMSPRARPGFILSLGSRFESWAAHFLNFSARRFACLITLHAYGISSRA